MEYQANAQAKQYIARIQRRIDYLRQKIVTKADNGVGYDTAEVNALEWALMMITESIDLTRLQELYEKYRQEQFKDGKKV